MFAGVLEKANEKSPTIFYIIVLKYVSFETDQFNGRYSSLRVAWYSGRAFL